jgi:hypothetical protein
MAQPTVSAPEPVASRSTQASKPQSSVHMNPDTPQSIAKEFVAAVDALEISDADPPTVSQFDRYYLLAAIRKIDGPNVDAEDKLKKMLKCLVQMANLLRKRQ